MAASAVKEKTDFHSKKSSQIGANYKFELIDKIDLSPSPMSIYLSVCLSFCLPVFLSVYLSISLSVCLCQCITHDKIAATGIG